MAVGGGTYGQRHDRIPDWPDHADIDVDLNSGHNVPDDLDNPAEEHTSVAEKMMAAVTGSILTSFIVTPLDVVRVRLQAQKSPSPPRLPSFLQLPPNLGVTACCREVFWVHNQSQFCVASAGNVLEAETAGASMSAIATSEASSFRTLATASASSAVSDCAAEETQRRSINSTFDGLRKIARNEGVFTLWRGLSPTLLMSVPANVIYFAGYDWLRTSPRSPMKDKVDDAYAPLVAGSFARVLSAFSVSPLEMLRTRMQATRTGEKGVLRTTVYGLKDMVSAEGVSSLWRGVTLTLWRDVPFSALYWWGYEFGRARLNESRARSLSGSSKGELSSSELLTDSFIAGAISGAIAAFVTTPFDVGKTRQQTVMDSKMSYEQRRALPESKSMPKFLHHIFKTEGYAGLFKGSSARCLKVAPACAIMISSYEIGKKMALNSQKAREEEAKKL